MRLDLAGLEAALARRERVVHPPLAPSAVLVTLSWRAGRPALTFTHRASHLRAHAGQVSFPGGRIDPLDPDPVAAALREAEEEVALCRSHVRVLGLLDDVLTRGNVRITPVLAVVPPFYPYRGSPDEVASVFTVGVEAFLDPSRHWRLDRLMPDGIRREVDFYWIDGPLVWGATARIVRETLALLAPFMSLQKAV
jgi:8-oxo-dGTP pyrophosphatase MutT (NUDIX family)